MTIKGFERNLLARGADLARWPAPQRAAAEALLAESAAARALLAEAERLERALAAAVRVPASDGALAARILGSLDGEAAAERVFGLGRLLAWAGSTAAAALVAGFFVGQSFTGADPAGSVLALVTGELAGVEALP